MRAKSPSYYVRAARFATAAAALFLLAAGLGGLAGCSSGNDAASNTAAAGQQAAVLGNLLVGLTDAEGDFVSYAVDVVSLTLTRADGAQVQVLPEQTRVDFAQYTDLTELLTAASVGTGLYVASEMTLDYSNAEIWAEAADGTAKQVTQILDGEGNPIAQLAMTVDLVDAKALFIAPGIPAQLTLDFDLAATNQVDFGPPVTCYVSPRLIAEVNVKSPKLHRIRGPLEEVRQEEGSFILGIRPFAHAIKGQGPRFGRMLVATSADTSFVIDDVSYGRDEGMAALAALPEGSAVVALGDLFVDPLHFVAKEVRAGSTVPGGDQDVISGNVTAREGNLLTVQGAALTRANGNAAFLQQVQVSISDNTTVSKALSPDPAAIGDISVGQQVTVFGELVEGAMDADEGHVHMELTAIGGRAASDGFPLALALANISLRPVAAFDFAGTGIDAENDADPNSYQIDTGALDLSGILAEAPLKVLGFPAPFGTAPLDFTALSVTDLSELRAALSITWTPKATDFFRELGEEGILPDLTGAGRFHHLTLGRTVRELTQENICMLTPAELGIYVLVGPAGLRRVFDDFGEMAAALAESLQNGARALSLGASGIYSADDNSLKADSMLITLR